MNAEKLKLLQEQVRIGGKGSQRRKKKVIHKTVTADDKKIQQSLKKLGANMLPGIEEVIMYKSGNEAIHFNNPKVQTILAANTFAISGHSEIKKVSEMFPSSIFSQLGLEEISNLRKYAASLAEGGAETGSGMDHMQGLMNAVNAAAAAKDDDDDGVPDLVENFDEVSKSEVV